MLSQQAPLPDKKPLLSLENRIHELIDDKNIAQDVINAIKGIEGTCAAIEKEYENDLESKEYKAAGEFRASLAQITEILLSPQYYSLKASDFEKKTEEYVNPNPLYSTFTSALREARIGFFRVLKQHKNLCKTTVNKIIILTETMEEGSDKFQQLFAWSITLLCTLTGAIAVGVAFSAVGPLGTAAGAAKGVAVGNATAKWILLSAAGGLGCGSLTYALSRYLGFFRPSITKEVTYQKEVKEEKTNPHWEKLDTLGSSLNANLSRYLPRNRT